ncbi:MAG: exodeoxyribonuclease V subunit gamma, partial [Chloroflexi bacterium]|nr:exodeoxyribonuclease V subunit gamma [Chloroflexota bacterium]
ERSLAVTLRELRAAPADALDEIAGNSDRAASVVRLFRHMRESTADYYDEEDLAEAAAGAVRAGSPALRDVGHVILYLPRRLSPGERGLVEALAGEGGLTALVGLTGDAGADEPARRLVTRLERACGAAEEPPETEPAAATRIVAVTDAEEEVRSALRIVMERLAAGTPLHRMAVLYPTTQPYALLAHEQFGSAGVPHNGPAVRTLAQTLSGRTLLGLLNLRQAEFRRDAVMDWLSAAPVLERAGGNPAPAHRWDTISRSAGIVGGPGQWRGRLAQHRRTLEAKLDAAERTEEADDWRVRRLNADIEQVDRLSAFIAELTSKLDSAGERTWAEFAAWGKELLDRYLGGEGHRRDWPDDEVEAHRSVESALESLSTLSDIRPRIDSATFRRALERELDAPAGRVGHFGDGVFIGRIRDAMGTDFDLVIVLGMTEGVIPARSRDDPLLPDRERAAAGDDMPLRTNRLAEDRRDYLAALATAPERILVYPRADLRGQRGRLPSRWLLEAASQLEGRTLFSADLDPPPARPWLEAVASFEGALAGDGLSASEQEYDLRSLLHWHRARRPLADHYLAAAAPSLRDGLSAEIARAGTLFSRWDGSVDDNTLAPSAEHAVSPTALQNWATCPRKYLLGNVLRVAETEKPEDALRISPLERGNLMHQALETFIRQAAPRSSPDQPWSEEERNALTEIGERLCDEAEAAGVTGKPLLWRLDRERILRDLAGFLDKDEEQRAEYGVVPEAAEMAFGFDGDDALIVSLDDGRQVAFRGRIDRVDKSPDGSRLLVLDYKSGSADFDLYKKLDADPVKGGKLLQLPIYGLAAQVRYGAEAAKTIDAYYWFVTEQSNYGRRGYPLGERELAAFREAVSIIVDGIGGGLFPARPGARRHDGGFENCHICPFDRICPRDRAAAWERKNLAPALRDYVNLAERE